MNKSPYTWICASLFCNNIYWTDLLRNGIKPYLNSLSDGECKSYLVEFNQDNGHNIRLALLTSSTQKVLQIQKCLFFFRNYFKSLEGFPVPASMADGITRNTIQFDLYYINFNKELFNQYNFQKNFSNTLIKAFDDLQVDHEMILTFAFHLNVLFIKEFAIHYPTVISELLNYYNLNLKKSDPSEHLKKVELMVVNYKKKKNVLLQIVEDIWDLDENNLDMDFLWVEDWNNSCRELIKNVQNDINSNKWVNEVYSGIIHNVNIQLGLPKDINDLLYFWIKRVSIENSQFSIVVANSVTKSKNSKYQQILNEGLYGISSLDELNKIQKLVKELHATTVLLTKRLYKRIDKNIIPNVFDEVRLFVTARNESLRLPYFIKYYTQLGVDRFFLIDNNSTDSTVEIALNYPNIHIFRITEGYSNYWNWMEFFLQEYGLNRWCMVVDVDELFYFPMSETLTLKALISYLEKHSYTAIKSVLLDTYSDRSLNETVYCQNDDPLLSCQYFDANVYPMMVNFFDRKLWVDFKFETYFGGMRERVFKNPDGQHRRFCLSKVSLFKQLPTTYLARGMHAINGAALSDIEGTVIHTKFLYDFVERVNQEAQRGEHYNGGVEYKIYNNTVSTNKGFKMINEDSVAFENTMQLIKLGLMKSSLNYYQYIEDSHPPIL